MAHASTRGLTRTPKRDAAAVLAALVGGLLVATLTAVGVALGAPFLAAGLASLAGTVRRRRAHRVAVGE